MAEVFVTSSDGYTGPTTGSLKRARPLALTCRSEAIAPAGCPIKSTCLIVDKYDVAICDGENRWYLGRDKYVEAGQPFTGLYG